ncbi:5-methyltetrahydropteroyltriglutamate--homocysteine S-methyltransferase [Kingella negevensis]|uniref:5-methyltetrahydropteroyltriglutamate--homocysteine methyltransferase n=1 Tax=Kingella negevensis TaxID=1522312 RepID=A0A238HHD2_9NEIS|nr:5-methyltetrahydropteroyltriglutamate--homocysteine S-methyltransferase [Kingella negevensis]MDK4696192.1 5-methyltetrahydropteroyltriglutamate--homocysteine S-methyltransferase [Kingella negevensis]SNB77135.1 5-methyltetrahydropteroyltriglutamate--homocysteine methyltransferase [Kingella negevensis]
MTQTFPRRADTVGSYLRTPELKQARADFADGKISREQLTQVEDQEIAKLVQAQLDAGISVLTDGEFRRSWWHIDFLENLNGIEGFIPEQAYAFKGTEVRKYNTRCCSKVSWNENHPFIAHYKALAEIVGDRGTVKYTIPSPNQLMYPLIWDTGVYENKQAYCEDVRQAYKDAIKAFYDAGCRYLQIDDVYWGTLCNNHDKPDFEENKKFALENIQAILADKPADLTITTHVCRGNYKSSYLLSGAYDPVAPELFGQTAYDGYFLEYDTERAGGFEPLKYFNDNPHKGRIVLGLVTSKFPELEDKEAVKARIAEAAKIVPLDQLALSPQCGFASTEEGNIMTDAEQWAKVRLVEEIAKEVWGERKLI